MEVILEIVDILMCILEVTQYTSTKDNMKVSTRLSFAGSITFSQRMGWKGRPLKHLKCGKAKKNSQDISFVIVYFL